MESESAPINQVEITEPIQPEQKQSIPSHASFHFKRTLIIYALLISGVVGTLIYVKTTKSFLTSSTTIPSSSSKTALSMSAEVYYLTGEVWKLVDNRKVELKQNDIVSTSDIIITSSKSRVVLSFDDGSIVRVDQDSQILLGQLHSNYMEVTNQKGSVYARVEKDQNHQFIVLANDIKISSLGTSFVVENKEDVIVKVFESTVEVTNEDKQSIKVNANEQWRATEQKSQLLSATEMSSDEFIAWNIKQDQKTSPSPESLPSPTTIPATPKITLKGSSYALGVILEWSIVGDMDVSKGFKVVKNMTGSPKYPGDSSMRVSDPSARRFDWQFGDGNEWHFRICQYLENGQCGEYSNEIIQKTYVNKQDKPSQAVDNSDTVSNFSIEISPLTDGKVKVSWSLQGVSEKGFKVLWSKNSDPTYPLRKGDSYHYVNHSDSREDTIDGLEGGALYYIRVCEYLGGRCGAYSNQKTIQL